MNYREIVGRFSHIDADFVRAFSALSADGGAAEVVVRFYPWWEHPLYVAASARGEAWGFSSYESGKREVRVRAVEPWAVHLSSRREVVEWRFEEQHPLLWEFAARHTLYANAPFDRRAFLDGLMALGLPNVTQADLATHVDLPPVDAAPIGLTLPAQLLQPAAMVFAELGVPVFRPERKESVRTGVVFLLDDEDYIIATDFEVDVPEFVHDAQWFTTDPAKSAGLTSRCSHRAAWERQAEIGHPTARLAAERQDVSRRNMAASEHGVGGLGLPVTG